jgi:hypothetical protein
MREHKSVKMNFSVLADRIILELDRVQEQKQKEKYVYIPRMKMATSSCRILTSA